MNLIERFSESLAATDARTAADLREYAEWQTDRGTVEFAPTSHDDVHIRTYLLHLRNEGLNRGALESRITSLKQFYQWAAAGQFIETNPFEQFALDRPVLSHEETRRREEAPVGNPQEREVIRLRGLVQIAEHLNRAADVQTALDGTLELLVRVMNLQAAWAFVSAESGIWTSAASDSLPHDFALAGAYGLPPGLEFQDRHFLRKAPDCHCQGFFRAGRLTRALNIVECTRLQLAEAANGETQGLLFHASVPLRSQGKLLGIVNVATHEWQLLSSADLQFLSAAGAQVAAALERAHLYDAVKDQRDHLERELQVAHDVQASLLPAELPDIHGFRLAADWRSAREVAGDFYDVFRLHDGRWGIVIGDVSDKGAPAALYMAMARALIRTSALRHHSPANTLMQVNETVYAESTYTMFVTLVYAVLDPETGVLTYANAGHNPPIVRRAFGGIEQLARTGRVVGAFDKLHLTERSIRLDRGDALILYTDGVTDALNPEGQDYGMDRLLSAVTAAPAAAAALLDSLRGDLAFFTQSSPQPDDITFFVVTRD